MLVSLRTGSQSNAPKTRGRMLALVSGLSVIVLLGFILWLRSPSESDKAKAEKPVPVTEALAETKAVPITVSTIGHVQPIAAVAVRARIDGEIVKVTASDGQTVKAGDTLFQLDDRQARAALDQAKAALAHDQAQLDYAKKEADRQQHLARNEFASRDALDQARSTAAALEASIASDQAQIENAQTQLSFTTIAAPIDGRLGSIAVKDGNIVSATNTSPLATINQTAPIYVAFSLPQSTLPQLRAALSSGPVAVRVTLDGDPTPVEGTVAFIENNVDAATGTIGVKASFANSDERLWPGQFAAVDVILRTEPHAIVVPSIAVQSGQSGPYVFVVGDDAHVVLRPVTLGATVGDNIVIDRGVSAGEHIVTTGQLRLTPGAKVTVEAGDGGNTPARAGT